MVSTHRDRPYQPLPLRILHGLIGVLAIAALLTGFAVYAIYDGRFGTLPVPAIPDIQGIHGTFGLFFLLVLPVFALYSFHAGYKRLIQADVVQRLTQQVGKPVWWVNLQRLMNTAMLVAATFSVISGRMMKEEWLPAGELNHIWYYLHLTAWAVLGIGLALHLLFSIKVGGVPLLLSMVSTERRPDDHPSVWLDALRRWLQRSN
jgi:Prokaryotic cytochrome b561